MYDNDYLSLLSDLNLEESSHNFYRLPENHNMILTHTTDEEVVMMDDNDIREHMLLSSLEDKPHDNSFTTLSSSTSSLIMEEDELDDTEFLDAERVGEIDPAKDETPDKPVTSSSVIVEEQDTTEDDSANKGIPGKFDVLCGQSRICANHTGNRRFQVVLDIYAPKYDGASSKQEKMALTKEIVACIANSGGRFLKYKDGLWQEISTVTARDKVSHALRTKVSSWKRHQQQKDKPADSATPGKAKPTHRRRHSRSRRTSASSVATSASDIVTSSFDSSDAASASLMVDLLKSQREIFASLTKNEESSEHPLKKEKQ